MSEDSAKNITVLIIDDHRLFAESLAHVLAAVGGIEVVGVSLSSAHGVTQAKLLNPDVILVDYQMPEMDGIATTVEIRRQSPDAMVVMLTGSQDDRTLLAAIEVGCCGFLTKDRASSEVVDAVRAAAAGESVISPSMLARLLPKIRRVRRSLGDDLSARELEVLELLSRGAGTKEVAHELHVSVNTVRNYVQSLLRKLGAHSKLEAVATAIREGIIDYSRGP
jgi:DNA-binding NarL/FixJ family response regulator